MLPFPADAAFYELIRLAKAEDHEDVTSRLMIGDDVMGVATVVQKQPGVIAGLPAAPLVCQAFDERLKVEPIAGAADGQYAEVARMPLLRLTGPLRSLLTAERTLLNLLQHLGGIATMTHAFVQHTHGTKAKIYDTRKTIPGYRKLAKYAVVCGGGFNHREHLADMVLVKDNHLAGVALPQLAERLTRLVAEVKPLGLPIEIEVDTLEQLEQVLKVGGIDIVLLDNMSCETMSRAIGMRNAAAPSVELEASGGVNLSTVRRIAECGVDRISVGAITHSAPALDVGIDVEAA